MLKLLIPCWLILTSCDLAYENNQRWLVTSVITDQYGLPKSELPVMVKASNYSDRDIIGQNVTDINGSAKVRTIAPINASGFLVEINMLDELGQRFDTTVSSLRIIVPLEDMDVVNIMKNDMTLGLGTIRINQLATLVFNISNTSGSSDTVYWELNSQPVHMEINSVDTSPGINQSIRKGRFLPADDPQSFSLTVVDNDTISFVYRSVNGVITTSGNEVITMNSQDQVYVFQY